MNNESHTPCECSETEKRTPACDVIEKPCGVRILLDIPGVSADKFDVNVENRILKISASGTCALSNRKIFYRRNFELSEQIDCNNIAAKVGNGVLEVTLPKLPSAAVHRIEVTGA